MELRELIAFVAIAEEGAISAAARRLHISQPSLSQTINALERELGIKLLVRSNSGVQPTEAGLALVEEARAIVARRDQALRTIAELSDNSGGVIRIGVPLEQDQHILMAKLAGFVANYPATKVIPTQLTTATQFSALRENTLDVGLVRERPAGPEFDAMLVSRENLGILLAAERAEELVGGDGVRLDALRRLKWVGYPREGSPAWFDELTAILRSHGIEVGVPVHNELELIAAVSLGRAFALAPPHRAAGIPRTMVWSPLVGDPLVRRTWAVWPACSRRTDIGQLIATLDTPADRTPKH
jgi:DNA-binding transcriptional LysR family regulator